MAIKHSDWIVIEETNFRKQAGLNKATAFRDSEYVQLMHPQKQLVQIFVRRLFSSVIVKSSNEEAE